MTSCAGCGAAGPDPAATALYAAAPPNDPALDPRHVGSPIFVILGDRRETPTDDVHRIGSIDGVHFENITWSGMRYHWASPVSGLAKDGVTHAGLRLLHPPRRRRHVHEQHAARLTGDARQGIVTRDVAHVVTN